MGKLTGKIAIVTGSSSGIGKATALAMAAQGAPVCVVTHDNPVGAEDTVARIAAAGGKAIFVPGDVSAGADCHRIVERTIETFGRVDILVNNAGITRAWPLEELGEAQWDLVLDTNLKSAYLMSRLCVLDMLKRSRGSVVNISSVHARASRPGHAAYAASKAGMLGLTRALACELGPRGIRCNAIVPGTIDLSLYPRDNRRVDRDGWAPRASPAQAMKRLGSPEEVAAVACFLASDDAAFVNGASVSVDGGLQTLLRDGL